MNLPAMERAETEARRFLTAVVEMKIKLKDDEMAWFGCQESGRLRRSSMDLTRALANLRRPG
jgi:hypothetical protein